MAHAIHINFGKHSGYSQHSHPGGWWKFGLFAVTATAIGAFVVHSIWTTGASRIQVIPDGMTIEVASQPFLPPLRDLAPPAPPQAVDPNAPAVAPVAPPAAPATSAEADTPASVESVQKASPAPVTTTAPQVAPPSIAQANSAPQGAAPPQAPALASANIHVVNFGAVPGLQSLAQQLNGRINTADVQYHDLTGDGVDEAIVPITSDGTQGDLGLAVLTEQQGVPTVIFTQKADRAHQGLVVSFDGSKLTVTSAAYGPSDANCCPSQITRTYYRWTGSALVVDHANTIVVPQGKDAD